MNISFEFFTSDCPSDIELKSWAKDDDAAKATPALWIYLLLRLKLLSTDSRLEVRHSKQQLPDCDNLTDRNRAGALHTLFRIFDACLDQLKMPASRICFKTVLVKLLETNEVQHLNAKDSENPEMQGHATRSWNETSIVEIEGISGLFSQWLDNFKGDGTLATMCQELFGRFITILDRHVLSVSNAVFTATTKMLAVVESAEPMEDMENPIVDKSWEMWRHGNPALHRDDSERKRNDNQDALIAYLKCLQELLRLTGPRLLLEQTESVIKRLWVCVVKSAATAYSADVDRMTPVQEMVLSCLSSIPTTDTDAIPELANSINGFVTVAYEQESDASGKTQTYVALSKAAMTSLESFVVEHIRRPHIDAIDMVVHACEALSIPIHLKYKWRLEGRGTAPWRKATMTVLVILETAIPIVKASKQDYPEFWEVAVRISNGIFAAKCNACANPKEIPDDQDFDIEAFLRIKKLMIPALGSSSIPDSVRRKFAESIFKNSIIHEPHIDDLARPGQELLEGLQSQHIGRVNDLPPSPRSKLSYLLLDELFDIVAVHDGSSERVKLAQAAAPYLILRAGLTLKAYIMEHPLRGLMPQPWSQKKEMFYILRKLIDLDSEPKAIPAAPGISSEHKKHLHRLYPLVMKALKAAWRDEKMTAALQEVLEAVGDDFRI